MSTASELFYSQGLRAVGVDTIIANASVAKASFYKHFPSKDDLVVAFLQHRDGLWRAWLKETVEKLSPSPADRPLAVFDALAQRFARADYRGCAFINSIVELANRDHAAHRAAEEHKRRVTEYIASLLRDAGIRQPGELAAQFMMLVDGAVVTAVREGSPMAAGRAKRIAKSILSEALASPAQPKRRRK